LTRLWNKNRILGFLDDEIDRNARQDQPTSILLIDIDGLARFNRADGFAAGDRILVEVSTRLQNSIRGYDKLGRTGGDEFLGVFPNCREEHLQHLAERLRRAAAQDPIRMECGDRKISVSLGGASSSYFFRCTGQELLTTAQASLAEAKREGGDTAVFLPTERKH
jgi:diguanylate cyclase (GGDEF)-like protein